MKILVSTLATLFALSFSTLVAQEDSLGLLDQAAMTAAREVVRSCDLKSTLEYTYHNALDSEIEHFKRLGLADAEINEVKDVMLNFFKEVMPYSEIEPEFIRFYATKFTEAELKEILAFSKTPTGKKVLNLSSTIMTSGVRAGQRRVHARLAELEMRVMPIIERSIGKEKP